MITADWLNARLDAQSTSEAFAYFAFVLEKYRQQPDRLNEAVVFQAFMRLLGELP